MRHGSIINLATVIPPLRPSFRTERSEVAESSCCGRRADVLRCWVRVLPVLRLRFGAEASFVTSLMPGTGSTLTRIHRVRGGGTGPALPGGCVSPRGTTSAVIPRATQWSRGIQLLWRGCDVLRCWGGVPPVLRLRFGAEASFGTSLMPGTGSTLPGYTAYGVEGLARLCRAAVAVWVAGFFL